MRFLRRIARSQTAQVLPMMALLAVAFIGLLGLAIDMGRLFVARTELSRALDSAALAGVVELPNTANAEAKATTYLTKNLPGATATFPPSGGEFKIRVKGTRTVDMVFMGLFGFTEVDVSATAAAGYGVVPLDVVMAIDGTGSMGASPCNSSQNNSGCPIHEAKNAGKDFTDLLLGSTGASLTQVGAVAYRGCYNPPRTNSDCIPGSWQQNLSNNATTVKNKINTYGAQGGTGTNNCLALKQARDVLFGTGSSTASNTLRFVVILTDGDNTWNSNAYGQSHPPSECRPSNPTSNGYTGTECRNAESQEMEMDIDTRNQANSVKAEGVEIYIVALGVCGTTNNNLCNTSMIGNSSYHDDVADRNLLKCIASSSLGTNDHYFAANTADELPSVFTQVAQNIAFRLVE